MMKWQSASEAFEKHEQQGWNEQTKLGLILDFMDRHDNAVTTPEMFDDYLADVAQMENGTWDGEPDPQPAKRNVFAQGVIDGLESDELTSGMTYPDQDLNEAYDHGVNVGQAIRFMGLGEHK